MKKFSFIFVLALFLGAAQAQASVISLSPQAVSVSNGQTVSLTISVDSQGAPVSTVEAKILYPTNLLTPTSFTFAPAWTPLNQSGYSQMSGGEVIKTAGYAHGFTGVQAFGTLTFTAVGTGTASLGVETSSIAYNTSGQNTVTGTQGSATITVGAAPVAVTTPTPAGTAQGTTIAPAAGTTSVNQAATGADLTPAAVTAPAIPLGANAGGAGGFHMSGWLWLLAFVVPRRTHTPRPLPLRPPHEDGSHHDNDPSDAEIISDTQ